MEVTKEDITYEIGYTTMWDRDTNERLYEIQKSGHRSVFLPEGQVFDMLDEAFKREAG